MKHQKHTKLTRPDIGQFHRNEWGILGTNCGSIQTMANTWIKRLSPKYKMAYLDADHKSADEEQESMGEKTLEYTDKINFHRLDWQAKMESHQYRTLFNDADVVLLNGNHFKANRQLVVIDPKKAASLQRKLDRLANVEAFILTEGVETVPGFLQDHLPEWEKIPVFGIQELDKIGDYLLQRIESRKVPLKGLILAGGQSTRMGKDKGLIEYFGKPHREYLYDLVAPFCTETYLSVRAGQSGINGKFPVIEDTFLGLGPKSAILSAFREDPNAAWLVLACDYPLMNKKTLEQLVNHRNPSCLATAFNSPHNKFPEPLITIWEPRSYAVLLQFLAQGYSCPRKVLINSNVHLIDPKQPEIFQNVNHPEEYEQIIQKLPQ